MKARPTILIIFLVPLAVLAFLMINLAVFHKNEIPSDTSKDLPKVRATVMETVVAEPGKIVRVKVGGKEVGSYTCSPADAAVAVIYLDGDVKKYKIQGQLASFAYPSPHPVSFTTVDVGNACFLVAKKGYSLPLGTITQKVEFYGNEDESDRRSLRLATATVFFTNLPKPIRVMSRPAGEEAANAEHYAKAYFYPKWNSLSATPIEKTDRVRIIGNAFCPSTKLDANRGYPMSADAGTDCVLVKLSKRRPYASDWTLTYHNAEIIESGNNRTLWLPTTQKVGAISGIEATVQGVNKSELMAHKPNSISGCYISFDQNAFSQNGAPKITPIGTYHEAMDIPDRMEILSVSPTPKEMGLTQLTVTSNFNGALLQINSKAPSPKPVIKIIPELKIQCRLTKTKPVGERTLLLPVHTLQVTDEKRLPWEVSRPVDRGGFDRWLRWSKS